MIFLGDNGQGELRTSAELIELLIML